MKNVCAYDDEHELCILYVRYTVALCQLAPLMTDPSSNPRLTTDLSVFLWLQDEDVPSPTALLHKLRALHSEARKVYGLDLFTAFLCDGGTKIETVVDSKDAAIAQVRFNNCLQQFLPWQ